MIKIMRSGNQTELLTNYGLFKIIQSENKKQLRTKNHFKNTLLAIDQCSKLTQSRNQIERLSDVAIIQNNAVKVLGKVDNY